MGQNFIILQRHNFPVSLFQVYRSLHLHRNHNALFIAIPFAFESNQELWSWTSARGRIIMKKGKLIIIIRRNVASDSKAAKTQRKVSRSTDLSTECINLIPTHQKKPHNDLESCESCNYWVIKLFFLLLLLLLRLLFNSRQGEKASSKLHTTNFASTWNYLSTSLISLLTFSAYPTVVVEIS